jgi:monoamine oxidase
MSKKRVVIVGAGMGGLTSALRLSHHGYDVDRCGSFFCTRRQSSHA